MVPLRAGGTGGHGKRGSAGQDAKCVTHDVSPFSNPGFAVKATMLRSRFA
jgi:hypothetical protein